MSVSPIASGAARADDAVLPVRVYYEDTDAGGVVYYANYAKFLERGRTEWLRDLNVDQIQLANEARRLFVVSSLAIQYRKPARLDDVVHVHSRIGRMGRASLEFDQRILRNGELLCEATVQVCCVDADTFRPAALPSNLRDLLEKGS